MPPLLDLDPVTGLLRKQIDETTGVPIGGAGAYTTGAVDASAGPPGGGGGLGAPAAATPEDVATVIGSALNPPKQNSHETEQVVRTPTIKKLDAQIQEHRQKADELTSRAMAAG